MEVIKEQRFKHTRIGKIPFDWGVTILGEILNEKPTYGANEPAMQYSKENTYRYIRITDIDEYGNLIEEEKKGITKKAGDPYLLQENDLIIARTGNTVGKSFLYQPRFGECAFAGYLIRFRIDELKYSTRLLFHFLHSGKYWSWVKNASTVGAQPNINSKIYQTLPLPLPPLPEQRKIAEILSTVDEQIAATQAVIEETEELKRGLMQELFTRGIGHTRFKETKIGRVPEEWEVKRFNKIVELSQYGLSLATTDDGTYPMFKMNNFENGKMSSLGVDKVTLSTKELEKYRLEKGDILFNRTNSIDLVGKTGLFDLEGDYVFASYLIRFKVDRKAVLPEFVNYYFNWSYIQAKLKNLATKGASQANISATVLKKFFVIPLPKVEEQEKIVEILSEIDVKLEQERKRKAELEELKRGLMQVLLTGKVRVKV